MKLYFLLILLTFSSITYSQNQTYDNSIIEDYLIKSELLIKKGKYLTATKELKNGLTSIRQKNINDKIRFYYKLGYAYQLSKAIDSANYYYKKGDDLFYVGISNKFKFKKHFNKASICFTTAKIDSAMYYQLKALKIAAKSKNKDDLFSSNFALAKLFLFQKNYTKTQYYLDHSKPIANTINDKLLIADILTLEGELYTELKKFKKAEFKLKEALSIYKKNNDYRGQLVTLGSFSKIYLITGRFDKASENTGQIMAILKEFEFSDKAKKLTDNTKQLYKLSKEKNIDSSSVKKAEKIVENNVALSNNSAIKIDQNKAIITYLENGNKASDFKNSPQNNEGKKIKIYKENLTLIDSLQNDILNSRNLEMETKFQVEKKEKENLQLKAEKAEQELIVEKEKSHKYVFASLASLALLLIMILYLFAKNRKKQLLYKAQLDIIRARQNEQDEIGKELHDNISKKLESIENNLVKKGEEDLANQTNAIKHNIKKISKDLSIMSFDDSPFEKQLENLAIDYQTNTTKVNILGKELVNWSTIAQPIKYNLFLVIQEAVSNSRNYANADNIVVTFSKKNKNINVTIKDDGIGFDKNNTNIGSGFRNMRVRVNDINGELKITSEKNKGTHIAIQFITV